MNNSDETQETRHFADNPETKERWEKTKALFEAASALSGKSRDRFLEKSCGDDHEMKSEVRKLLASFEDSESFLESPAIANAASLFENKKTLAANSITGEVGSANFIAGTVLAKRYRILGLVGKGGMGEVYKAEDLQLNQVVALKFLPEAVARDKSALARFRSEVRLARQVSHVNVCRVFDIGEIDGKHFLSMEYIDGDDLSSLLRRVGRLSSERAIEISRQLCVGMSAIHNAGILHRDFKPANVIVDSKGKARITDFGIAGVETEIAGDAVRVGTPAYMSPEQISGKDISTKSDIYALGLVLYEIFTGKQAFQANSIPELIKMQQSETPTNPSDFVKGINPLVESVISQCLEKNPANRPASALHVALALPGGNPMQIALEAGQTPSPEMIAATPQKGVLNPKTALLLLAVFIAATFSIIYIHGFEKSYNFIPFEKSAEVLAEKAQTMTRNFGYTEKPADIKYRFDFNNSFTEYAKKNEAMSNVPERLRSGQPYLLALTYRQSPIPLEPWYSNRVFYFDPPFNVPGMINVYTDTTGNLIEFSVVPPAVSPASTSPTPIDWSKFFTEAGLDINKFEQTESEWTPQFAFDERRAWKGVMADWADIPLRIEAAGFQGKPTYFRVVAPWNKPGQDPHITITPSSWGTILMIVLLSIIVIGVVLLVWSNIKNGRADLRGTFHLVLFVLAIYFPTALIQADHTLGSINEFFILGRVLSDTLFAAVLTGLVYCALEPFVRRWWSEYLISWSRVLAGDFRNPMVGRDILFGALLAAFGELINHFGSFIAEFGFGEKRDFSTSFMIDVTNSVPRAMGLILESLANALTVGLSMLMTILILYFLTRSKKASVILFGTLLFLLEALAELQHPTEYVFDILGIVFLLFFLNRFGLLVLISSLFFVRIIGAHPLIFDQANILFPQTIITLTIIFGLAAYAAYISTGGRLNFSEGALLK